MKKLLIVLVTLLVISSVVLAVLLIGRSRKNKENGIDDPSKTAETTKKKDPSVEAITGLLISEVMPSNKNTLTDPLGEYADWIELYNSTDKALNLAGYSITDDEGDPTQFVFPSYTLDPGAYLLLWANGGSEMVSGQFCLPFKLSSNGEKVCLFDPNGYMIDSLQFGTAIDDKSFGKIDGKVVLFGTATPARANDTNTYDPYNPEKADGVTIRINEFATKSSVTFSDSDGDHGAWAELYNYGDQPVSLKGLFLSDNEQKPTKWAFPEITLGAHEYLIVHMKGKEVPYTAGSDLQASFTLAGDETSLGIYDVDGKIVDTCKVYDLISNLTCARDPQDPEKWHFYAHATPGKENSGTYFDSIDSANYPGNKILAITEVCAANYDAVQAPDKKYYDYIEICNPGSASVDLSGFYIGKTNFEKAVKLPKVTLAPGAYMTLWCGDTTSYSSSKKMLSIDFGVSRDGTQICLYDSNGIVVDTMQTKTLYNGISCGVTSLSDATVRYLSSPTPGEANPHTGYSGLTAMPTASVEGGYVNAGTRVTLTAAPGASIYYTVDGSAPTEASSRYTGAVTVNETMTLRAIAVGANKVPSEVFTVSYLVSSRVHDLPVIFLSTDPEYLFSDSKGILVPGSGLKSTDKFPFTSANFWKETEVPIHFEYMTADGSMDLSFDAGCKIFGQYSRAMDQKSLGIKLRDKYGVGEIAYNFYGEEQIVNVFSSLVLRNGGQDSHTAHIRDALCSKIVLSANQVLGEPLNIETMDYRPVVVYINGAYYGIYDLREKIDADYISNRTGVDPDDVDLIKGNSKVIAGSYADYKELLNFLNENPLTNTANYQKACEMVDIDSLIDYWICVSFFCNTDSGNIKFYKAGDGKWRWIIYDNDWALYPSTYKTSNSISNMLNTKGHGVGHAFSTVVLRSFMANSTFKDKFLTRYGQLLNTVLDPSNTLPILDELIDELRTEMPYHIDHWKAEHAKDAEWCPDSSSIAEMWSCSSSVTGWLNKVYGTSSATGLADILPRRRDIVIGQLKDYLGLTNAEVAKYFPDKK